jgi:hypothetical protein
MSKARSIIDDRYYIFGAEVRAKRAAPEREWNKIDLALQSGLDRGVIGCIESAKSKYKPQDTTIAKICSALGMDSALWITWLNNPHGPAPNGQLLKPTVGGTSLEGSATGGEISFRTSFGPCIMMKITQNSGVKIVIEGMNSPTVLPRITGKKVELHIVQSAAQMTRQA